MSDIYCAKCGEPWDAYGIKHGDMEEEDAEKFMSGAGCPACHFGTVCVSCSGSGRIATCINCAYKKPVSGCNCKILVWSPRSTVRGYEAGVWYYGYRPEVVVVPSPDFLPTDRVKYLHCADGSYRQRMALCPVAPHEPCPACDGSGKLVVRDPDETYIKAVASAVDATDEDPIEVILNYEGA